MLYRISTILSFLIFRYFFSLEIEGRDCIPKKGNFILAANHLSNLDPPLLASACPRRIFFAAKKELFSSKIFALYLKAVGALPVERKKITIQTLRRLISALEARPLLIFPEGSRGVGLENSQPGVGFLYKMSQVPVVAAKIKGTDKILASGKMLPKRAKLKVTFKVVEGIAGLKNSKEITTKVAEEIKQLAKK